MVAQRINQKGIRRALRTVFWSCSLRTKLTFLWSLGSGRQPGRARACEGKHLSCCPSTTSLNRVSIRNPAVCSPFRLQKAGKTTLMSGKGVHCAYWGSSWIAITLTRLRARGLLGCAMGSCAMGSCAMGSCAMGHSDPGTDPPAPWHRRVPRRGEGVLGRRERRGRGKMCPDLPLEGRGLWSCVTACTQAPGTFPYLPGYLVRAVYLGVNLYVFSAPAFITVCSERTSMHLSL